MQSKHQSFLTRNYATTALFIPPAGIFSTLSVFRFFAAPQTLDDLWAGI